jgi:hypothetical protein
MNTVLIVAQLLLTCFLIAILIYGYSKVLAIRQVAREFFEPDKATGVSPFGKLVDSASASVGNAFAMQIKTSIMGKLSGSARQEKAVEQAILSDTSPLLGLVQSMPSLRKLIEKNPALAGLALNYLQKRMPVTPGNGTPGEPVKFNL